ncbi:hypothetical protein RHMOL_Rhmol08G0118300 [Rhododendron molle]|uniref:Uncharacterized protein n=1 Tax=Rhododendron molle TaxID=49168 RepID=A0ACC0MMQ7_RHOML|nr:hypothetical protein RHMOL_Rhmol08G0118300 [Rhododendron molle]
MGKYARQKKEKCKGIGEIEVMEVAHDVGVKTRARALSVEAGASSKTAKKRKVSSGRESKLSTTSLIQLRSRRRPASPAASRCSSNACSDVGGGSAKVVDLEDVQIETSTCFFGNRGRRETTPSSENQAESGDLGPMARPTEANSSSAGVMPSEIELDEFFAAAEKDIQKRFTDKYNYDVANDVPLGGRYEWIQLKP